MEVFTFIFMGGDVRRITVLPIHDRVAAVEPGNGGDLEATPTHRSDASSFGDISDPAVSAILDKFAAFDAREAQCYLPEDKQMILGVIETGIGSIDAFNQLVRSTFAKRGTAGGIKKSESGRRAWRFRLHSRKIVLGMEKAGSEF